VFGSDEYFVHRAYLQALKSAGEGGIPVGACLSHKGVLVSEGRNRRQQERTIILHAETDCLHRAGLLGIWSECTLYTTMSPCIMCAGAIAQFQIPRVVIADATNFSGNEAFLRERGVAVEIQEYAPMIDFFARWRENNAALAQGDNTGPAR